jgi:hypothetical protein
MNRSLLNLIIDLLAASCLLVMAATGYVLRFPMPPSTNRTHELWSLSRHEWGTIHSWASLGLLAILVVHVALHWPWIVTMISRRFTHTKGKPPVRPWFAGLLTVVALVAMVGLWAAVTHLGVRERDIPLHLLSGEPEIAQSSSESSPETLPLAMSSVPGQKAINFWRDVMPIFETSCIGCHGPKKQRSDFRVDRREDFFAPGDAAPLIVPGDADASRLIAIVSGEMKDMKSAEDHLLPPGEIALLKAWINAGADWPDKASTSPPTETEIKP